VPVERYHVVARSFEGPRSRASSSEKADERRTVAFAHFKMLLANSNLPELMGMSPDEIINLVRTV